MIEITQPNMILMKGSVEVSRHRSVVEAMERASQSPGVYTLIRPDATIVVSGDAPEPEPEPEPTPDPEPTPEPEPTSLAFDAPRPIGMAQDLYYFGRFPVDSRYTYSGQQFPVAFMTPPNKQFTPDNPARLSLFLHPDENGAGSFVVSPWSKSSKNVIELRNQEDCFQGKPTGWWGYTGGQAGAVGNYNGERIAASIDYVIAQFGDRVDVGAGFILGGVSLGGTGAILQSMILPRHREKIAIVQATIAHMLFVKNSLDRVASAWRGADSDAADFRQRYGDLVNIHYSIHNGSNDPLGVFDMEFIEICEREKISCSATWLRGGHSPTESGYNLPTRLFYDPNQDYRLDQILPVITGFSGNYHGAARGHHNRGVSWDQAGIVDTTDHIEIPLRYVAMKNIGPDIPDQPDEVTFTVTLRRVKNFTATKVKWALGNQSGIATAVDGLITIPGLVLVSDDAYTALVVTEDSVVVEPEPTPEPEPPAGKPADFSKAVNESRLINFDQWNWATSRYTRAVPLVVWTKDAVDLKVKLQSLTTAGGGKVFPFSGTDYRVTLSGIEVGGFPGGSGVVTVPLDLTKVADGWHILDVTQYGDETSVPLPVYVLRHGVVGQQDWVPVFTSSHEIKDVYHIKWVPAKHDPLTWPLGIKATDYLPFSEAATGLTGDLLTGSITGHPRYLVKHQTGVLGTGTKQRYFWSDMIAKTPVVEMIDGPRGGNSLSMCTHFEVGNATFGNEPDSPIVGNVYFCTPWSFGKIRASGEVVTLAGFRHKSPPNYFNHTPELENIGDWSEIDPTRRQFRELWGMCWIRSTLETNLDADPIPTEANLRPHYRAPIALLADSQMDAIRSVEFDSHRHGAIPKIREFYHNPGCDLWDCVAWGDKIIAAERKNHRIIQLDSTGNVERIILQGADLAFVAKDRIAYPRSGVTIAQLQAEPVVCPEGMAVVDDWLYYGSSVVQQVKRVHLVTGEIEYVCPVPGPRRQFSKIAVSNGDTGPKGTVFQMTWDIDQPIAYLPDGTKWQMPWAVGGRSYGTAVGVGHGRILHSSVMQGVAQIRKSLHSDKHRPALFSEGHDEWVKKGYYLSHGVSGESPFGLPLPWGESQAMDDYLKGVGHEQSAITD